MAKMPMFDPRDSEVLSPLMAGFSEGLGVLSSILDLNTKQIKGVTLEKLPWINSEGHTVVGVLYQAPANNKLWLTTPPPVIRKNGVIITPSADHFTIDPVGGGLFFEEQYALLEDDNVTVDATIVTASSKTIYNILQDISELKTKAAHDKGYYADPTSLKESVPTGADGDYAIVGTTDTIWLWDTDTQSWVDSHKVTDLSNYYTKGETDNLLNNKEGTINPQGSTESSDNYYYGGRKQWVDLLYKVRNTALTGLDTSTAQTIAATDTMLAALGKLQAQINQHKTDVQDRLDSVSEEIDEIDSRKADRAELSHKIIHVELDAEGWTSVSDGIYRHTFTDENITDNMRLDLAFNTDDMMKKLSDAGVYGLTGVNDGGTASVLAYGEKPAMQITVQIGLIPIIDM